MAVAVRLRLVTWMALACFGQVWGAAGSPAPADADESMATSAQGASSAEVTVQSLDIFDEPDDRSFIIGELVQGDRVRVRGAIAGRWLKIDPPPAVFCWIERSAIDHGPGPESKGAAGRSGDAGSRSVGATGTARVIAPGAVIRFGHEGARMPGPPRAQADRGTVVRLIARAPLVLGRGKSARTWCAIAPPAGVVCFVWSEGTREIDVAKTRLPAQVAATQTTAASAQQPFGFTPVAASKSDLKALPPDVAAEFSALESIERSISSSQPITEWRFESVRARYQALLKGAGNQPAVEEAIRARLADLTRREQAVTAAQMFEKLLAASRARDHEVAQVERRIVAAGRAHARAFNAVGFVQPSARSLDGKKLYVLIGKDGSTLAYLDIPPGLAIDPLLSNRLGVRGTMHYNADLSARLITVRDLETVESKR